MSKPDPTKISTEELGDEPTEDGASAANSADNTDDPPHEWVWRGDNLDPTNQPDGRTEETQQGMPIVSGMSAPGHYPTDAKAIRTRRFAFPPLEPEEWYQREGMAVSGVYPDALIHTDDLSTVPDTITTEGGTLVGIEAWLGSGKSTLVDQLATYQMQRGERIVVPGRQKTSEWRRMKDWASVWLPANVQIDTRWLEVVDAPEPDLDRLCRDVRRYDGIRDLISKLQAQPRGTYNVVYPDPLFRQCEDVMDDVDAAGVQTPSFTPKGLPNPTPASNWWFPFLSACVLDRDRRDRDGEPNFMSVHLDEFKSIASRNPASGDENHYLYENVQILSEMLIEMRKANLSVYAYFQKAEKVSQELLSEFTHWMELSNAGRSNRVTKAESPPPFRKVPMDYDLLSSRSSKGFGICYSGARFSEFQWSNLGYPRGCPEFVVELGVPESTAEQNRSNGIDTDAIRAEDSLLTEYKTQDGGVHELRVRAPGSGRVDLSGDTPTVAETLESPFEDTSFPASPIRETDRRYELVWRNQDDEGVTVAKIPKAGHAQGVDG